jgi:hypothetical protein
MSDHSRDPWSVLYSICADNSPWVILNDFGGAFSMVR